MFGLLKIPLMSDIYFWKNIGLKTDSCETSCLIKTVKKVYKSLLTNCFLSVKKYSNYFGAKHSMPNSKFRRSINVMLQRARAADKSSEVRIEVVLSSRP